MEYVAVNVKNRSSVKPLLFRQLKYLRLIMHNINVLRAASWHHYVHIFLISSYAFLWTRSHLLMPSSP
jgi:hypothetical protein